MIGKIMFLPTYFCSSVKLRELLYKQTMPKKNQQHLFSPKIVFYNNSYLL